ncbi:tail fiber assembly protein [Pseudomonas phage phiK7A1]|uniref:Tail fiber assembly protein n=1 Tax=Pseudomonas phage phiK7A1 TaxID=2759194 RepID=A0A7H0XFT7_9CAUD|nr:tail fiber assembly protein [Pseudomonas phage phiK7A1]
MENSSMKQAYQYAPNGLYIGWTDVHESPLEPGTYLIPANATTVKPPVVKDGYIPKWNVETQTWDKVRNDQFGEDHFEDPIVSEEDAERTWRNYELARADIEFNKVTDGEGTGTVKAWKAYRIALRAWPDTEGFPDSTKRPVAPDVR